VFTVLFLDAAHAIITSEILAEGTVTVNTVYPREVIKRALHHNAAALVIAHNHPSGRIEPSNQDRELTRSLYLACSLLHITLLDHLIIGSKKRPYSFADSGLMVSIGKECRELLGG
jgi:DNA repair protein RadC